MEPAQPDEPTRADPLLEAAHTHLGVDYLYPYQRLVVANTLDAVSSDERELAHQIVVLPTGSGKTLCFSLPAWLLEGVTLVVYPLLALMKDQARRAAESGLRVATLVGGQKPEERRRVLEQIRQHRFKLVITNPEMLAVARIRDTLRAVRLDHMVIDEAHCVSEWGETFRPAYLELGSAIEALRPAVTTAFTATASDPVLDAVRTHLFGDRPVRVVRADPDRPNISYHVAAGRCKQRILRSLIGNPSLARPVIVFCRSRTRTEEVARFLSGVVPFNQLAAYHAGLGAGLREQIEQWFFSARDSVLVSTCAYGMGVDKSDVRTVIHYEPPASVEAFLQESGRAGRDRKPAVSVLMVSPPDYATLGRDSRSDLMLHYASHRGCRRAYLMRCMGGGSDSCFGCDACTPNTVPAATRTSVAEDLERAASVMQNIRRNPRRFSADDLIAASDWTTAERELLHSLQREGVIRCRSHRPWRGLLTAR